MVARPLLCNVADLLHRPGARRRVRCEDRLGPLAVAGTRVAAGDAASVGATLEWVSDGVLATGTVEVGWQAECRRCLHPVAGRLRAEFRELFEAAGRRRGPADPDRLVMTGDAVDLEPLAREVVLLGLPLAPVCDPGCRGLCPSCGEDRNAGDCECAPEVGDPRWAVLDALRDEAGGGEG